MFQKKDFAEFTIPELIQKVWEITDALKNNHNSRYFFWLPPCKGWCLEYLKQKWKPSCLPSLKIVFKRIEEQNVIYSPGAYVDHEKYMEVLVRVKEIRKRNQVKNSFAICVMIYVNDF